MSSCSQAVELSVHHRTTNTSYLDWKLIMDLSCLPSILRTDSYYSMQITPFYTWLIGGGW